MNSHPLFEKPIRIRFSHCDPAGIVFYPQYLIMLNGVLEDWFTEGLGIAYDDLLGVRRVGTPTLRLECDFKAVSRMGDIVSLGLSVERMGQSSLTLNYVCQCHNKVRFLAHQVLVFTDLNTHRSMPIPNDVRAAIAALLPTG
ncbi:acyl-CoA thioesterase [Limnohabitans sp.]|uniref:acyl-CoA thioesterase n=1 Tax=Limnohabitans sp. TaxID=1907725 RepID=UPI0038B93A3F